MLKPYARYFDFGGRSSRREFWLYILFVIAMTVVAEVVDKFIDGRIIGPIYGIWFAINVIPSLALYVRRLHDIGKSGWWVLIQLIPIIGLIVWLVFMLRPGEEGANRFGPEPIETRRNQRGRAEALAPTQEASDVAALERLSVLRGQGLLTEEEFAFQKAKLMPVGQSVVAPVSVVESASGYNASAAMDRAGAEPLFVAPPIARRRRKPAWPMVVGGVLLLTLGGVLIYKFAPLDKWARLGRLMAWGSTSASSVSLVSKDVQPSLSEQIIKDPSELNAAFVAVFPTAQSAMYPDGGCETNPVYRPKQLVRLNHVYVLFSVSAADPNASNPVVCSGSASVAYL